MSPLSITLIILVSAIVLLISKRMSVDLVALLVLVALGLTRVLTPQEVFSGLSDNAVITIMAIFVLAHGLEVTGIAERMGNLLVRAAAGSETRLLVVVMSVGAFMSMFMNNIAAASILLPATSAAAHKAEVKLSRLLMPLAFGTLLGGMATLFTTTNIVVSEVLQDNGLQGFNILDFAPVGLPLVMVGIVYMAVWGRRMLPAESPAERSAIIRQAEKDLLKVYALNERLFRARVPAGSYLIDRSLAESTFREKYGLNVVAIERSGGAILAPNPDFVFHKGDIMLLEGRLEEFRIRDVEPYLEILPMRKYDVRDLVSASTVILEVVLTPRSQLVGQTLRETHFREKYGMTVLAVWNGERVIRTGLSDLRLEFGDALLIQGPRSRLPVLRSNPDLILLTSEEEYRVRELSGKGWLALTTFILTVSVAAFSPFPVGVVILAGALVMVITNILTMEQVYRAIEWRIIFLVAGMLPLGIAMTKTGAAQLFADALTGIVKPFGPMVLLLGFLLFTVLLTQVMKGAAVAAVMAPIAIQASQQLGVDPRAMAMAVALATSMAFITPLGHPVNILMMGPGGYRFSDFSKVGLPLTVILIIVVVLLLPVFWPMT